jgi:Flp pilus assembly protein TadG
MLQRCTLLSETRKRRGAAATELALWLPFLVLMFVIAADYCRVFFASQTIQNCACAGAMYASGASSANPGASPSENPAVNAALAEGASLDPPLQASNVNVATSGGQTQVTVTYDFPMLVRWPGNPATLTISKTVTMTVMPALGS